jgi:WhiB family transcriptional regulator, redox-sensing transcriptional regulator
VKFGPSDLAADLVVSWKNRAACVGYPSSVFFPTADTPPDLVDKAKSICEVCPVAQDCLEYAFETNQVAGVWGGYTEAERRSMRRKWLSVRKRTA